MYIKFIILLSLDSMVLNCGTGTCNSCGHGVTISVHQLTRIGIECYGHLEMLDRPCWSRTVVSVVIN